MRYRVVVKIEGWPNLTADERDEMGGWGDAIRAFRFYWRKLPDGHWYSPDEV